MWPSQNIWNLMQLLKRFGPIGFAIDFLKNIIHTHMIITFVVCQTHAAQAINNLQYVSCFYQNRKLMKQPWKKVYGS